MGKFSNTWSLMGASWQLLKKDKEILIFPVISGLCCLIVLASFAAPAVTNGTWRPPGAGAPSNSHMAYYATLFLFYFCNYFIIVFFNAAIVACAAIRMKGGDPTVSDGLRAAVARLSVIAGWALVQATVGLIFRVIIDRSERLGTIVAVLFGGIAWTMISFLVIPIMVIEKKGPIAALQESTALLKKTWGEQLVGNFSFGLVFFVLAIPAFALIFFGLPGGGTERTAASFILAIAYLTGLGLIQSALHAIFQSVLYLYLRNGRVPRGFEAGLVENAIAQR